MSQTKMLTPEQRIKNYMNNGRVNLTFKQGRRYNQKWRKFTGCADEEESYARWKHNMYTFWYGEDYKARGFD